MNDRVQLRFVSLNAAPRIPYAVSLPDQKDMPPSVVTGEGRKYQVRSAGLRGAIRHAAFLHCLERLPEDTTVDVKTVQLNDKGGVKGDDRSPTVPARKLDTLAQINPQVSLFGSGDPFTPGRLNMQHMESVEPIPEGVSITQDIVRRPVDVGNLPVEVTDTAWLEEYNRFNRMRSQLATAETRLLPLQKVIDRPNTKLDERGQRVYNDVLAGLADEFGREFTSYKDVKDELARVLEAMHERAMPTTSEQMIQRFHIIPAHTKMTHRMDLIRATPHNCGLFVAGMDDLWRGSPYLGGRAASGCGGMFDITYEVSRLDGRMWVKDCVMTVAPDDGVNFEDANKSLLRRYHQEWLEADFSQFDFSYERTREVLFGTATPVNGGRKTANGGKKKR